MGKQDLKGERLDEELRAKYKEIESAKRALVMTK